MCVSRTAKREYKGLHPFGAHSAIDRSFGFRASFFRDRRTVERAIGNSLLSRIDSRFSTRISVGMWHGIWSPVRYDLMRRQETYMGTIAERPPFVAV